MSAPALGVSFVVPVFNGERWLDEALDAILAQKDGRPFELIVVEDGSTDSSSEILARRSADPAVQVLTGSGRGAAAAVNLGIRAATMPVICQVDQDVVLQAGWMTRLLAELDDPGVGGVQGQYVADPEAPLLARLSGYELELRYQSMESPETDHICTGNSAYRAAALQDVGLFDVTMGYGYDNDMSYRLGEGGYRLVFCREARSLHRWREGLGGYFGQQYGLGYGRLDLVARHPSRLAGDRVSGLGLILHVPAMAAALGSAVAGFGMALFGGPWMIPAVLAALLFVVLSADLARTAVRAVRRFRDPAALLIVPLHLLRDVVWAWAAVVWGLRRLLRRPSRPDHSMG